MLIPRHEALPPAPLARSRFLGLSSSFARRLRLLDSLIQTAPRDLATLAELAPKRWPAAPEGRHDRIRQVAAVPGIVPGQGG